MTKEKYIERIRAIESVKTKIIRILDLDTLTGMVPALLISKEIEAGRDIEEAVDEYIVFKDATMRKHVVEEIRKAVGTYFSDESLAPTEIVAKGLKRLREIDSLLDGDFFEKLSNDQTEYNRCHLREKAPDDYSIYTDAEANLVMIADELDEFRSRIREFIKALRLGKHKLKWFSWEPDKSK